MNLTSGRFNNRYLVATDIQNILLLRNTNDDVLAHANPTRRDEEMAPEGTRLNGVFKADATYQPVSIKKDKKLLGGCACNYAEKSGGSYCSCWLIVTFFSRCWKAPRVKEQSVLKVSG